MTERRGEIDPKTGRQAVYDDEKIVHCLRPGTTSMSPGCEVSGRCTCNCADCNGRTWRDAEEPQPYGRYKPIECVACGAGSTLSPVPGYRGRCTACGLVFRRQVDLGIRYEQVIKGEWKWCGWMRAGAPPPGGAKK